MPTISYPAIAPDSAPPVLLSFASGAPLGVDSATAASAGGGKLKLDLKRNPSERKRHQCEAQLENDTMRYAGVNYGRDGSNAKAAGSLLIGVHRKGSGTVQLSSAQLFVMRPTVKVPKVSLAPPERVAAISSGAEYTERKRQLITQLGAAKAKKKQRANEAGAVSADRVLDADALDADIANAAREAAANPAQELTQHELHPLHPAFELTATTIAAAYPPTAFASERLWASFDHKPLRSASKNAEERAQLGADKALFPPFIMATLAGKLPGEKAARVQMLKATLCLTYLLRFATLQAPIPPSRAGEEAPPDAKRLSLPPDMWRRLLAEFTEPMAQREGAVPLKAGQATKRRLTQPMREKLSMHCLCLALVHVCDGRLRCDALASSLSLTAEKCAFYLKQLGCEVTRSGGDAYATLKLPLTFPKASRGGPPKRG